MISALSPGNADLNHLASVRMKSGIALLDAGDSRALQEAVRCFDEAVDLRRQLPLAENPRYRYGLAAGWINRADALTRLGGPENLADAVNSYTAAIELLTDPPADDDGAFVRRRAIAWMNRGIALEEQKSEPALAEALLSYKEAIKSLGGPLRATGDRLVLASAWINLGTASLRSAGKALAGEACAAAEHALALLAENESKDLAAAEAGLKARHILCQAIMALLGGASLGASTDLDLINKMTDAVEGALNLAQSWEAAGETRFRPLATRFFHAGVLAYERHQSHFLPEFLLEHLEPKDGIPHESETWFAIAKESLSRVRRGLRNCDFALLATPEGIRQLDLLREMRDAEVRISNLTNDSRRDAGFAPKERDNH